MPVRVAAVCGLLVPLTSTAALLFGGLAQPDAFSSADDDISDLGAETAASAWNLQPHRHESDRPPADRLCARALAGALARHRRAPRGRPARCPRNHHFPRRLLHARLPGIDSGCENDSWRSDANHIVSGISAGLAFAVPLVLALAFRRNPRWRDTWLPTLLAVPAFIVASIAFSAIGDGAATRAGAVAWSLWLGFTAFQLLRKAESGGVRTEV
jgi:hypothetical protein